MSSAELLAAMLTGNVLAFIIGGMLGAMHAHKLRDERLKVQARVQGLERIDGKYYRITEGEP